MLTSLFLASLALLVRAEEQQYPPAGGPGAIAAPFYAQEACGPHFVNCSTGAPRHRPCDNPCNLSAPDCGLGVCACPSNCSSLWFHGSCKDSSAQTLSTDFTIKESLGAECRDIQADCRVSCFFADKDEYPNFYGKVVGACIGYSSYQRPYCFFPGVEGSCEIAKNVYGNVVLKNGVFSCVKEVPKLLKPGQYEVCPLGYYPTCLLIDSNLPSTGPTPQ